MMKNMQWTVGSDRHRDRTFRVGVLPARLEGQARTRSERWRAPRPAREDRRCAEGRDGYHRGTTSGHVDARQRHVFKARSHQSNRVPGGWHHRRCRVPHAGGGCRNRVRPIVGDGRLFLPDKAERREPAPRRDGHAGAGDDRTPRQRARRRRADRRPLRRSRSDPRAAPRRQRRSSRQGDHPLDRATRS